MAVIHINKENFEQIKNGDQVVLIDFYADWCGPCRMVAPVVEEIAKENANVVVGKINVDDDPELAQAMIDELAASMKEANKSTYDLLKNKGHSGFTVEFEMKSSDGFIICTASNGTLTYKMNERNFQNG